MEPRLYTPLRQALGVLFSLPTIDPSQPQPSYAEAHELLMNLQSRNVRRKILSTQQRYRDSQQKQQQKGGDDRQSNGRPPELIAMGSSWLANLLLVCRGDAHISPTEQLFAAQTLLQRLRRNKLEESIDLEIEQADISEYQALQLYKDSADSTAPIFVAYLHLVEQWNPFIGRVLAEANLVKNDNVLPESQWKGQVTLLTLSSVLFMKVSHSISNDAVHSMPLLQTLASGIATVVLRLLGESNDEQFSFVPVLRETFGIVRRPAESFVNESTASLAHDASLQVTLAAIPESLLGSPGGQDRRGRLSLHPKALEKAYADLRQRGVENLRDHISPDQVAMSSPMSLWWLLRTLQTWARFLPLSAEIWQLSLPIVRHFLTSERSEYVKSALMYLLSIWESAASTEDEVLAMIVGLTSEGHQQAGKKKQSSRSKKRHKELLNERSDGKSLLEARNDLLIRGQVACLATSDVWDCVIPHFNSAMALAGHSHGIDGEGPIGCLAAAGQGCLPFLLKQSINVASDKVNLFTGLAEALQRICACSNPTVRVLALEPIYGLHEAFLQMNHDNQEIDANIESQLVQLFYQCSMSLAVSCGYPSDYFDSFSAPSDGDLEVYRNDVRDMVRSVNGSEEGGSTANVEASRAPLPVSQKIIHRVLHSILESLSQSRTQGRLPEETAIHALSALAKPLNHQAQSWDHFGGQNLEIASQCVLFASESVLSAFQHQFDNKVLLPIARTLCIGLASFSPMLSKLAFVLSKSDDEKCNHIRKVLQTAIRVELAAIEWFDELPVGLSKNYFDVRGVMRGPGGEDHVACVALMRLCSVSKKNIFVAQQFVPHLSRMCDMYRALKDKEIQRGPDLLNLQGTTPKSRRIFLGVICRVEAATNGGASDVLQGIFRSAIENILAQHDRSLETSSFLSLCEASYDLSAFPKNIVANFFETSSHDEDACHRILVHAFCHGFQHSGALSSSEDTLLQWNRLRAALGALIKAGGVPDVPNKLGLMVVAFLQGECEAILSQCALGPSSQSAIFCNDIVGDDGLPAGVLIHVIDILLKSSRRSSLPNCLMVLVQSRQVVLSSIVHVCSNPVEFLDPRCTLAEAWFSCMTTVTRITAEQGLSDGTIHGMLVDSATAAIQLILYPSLGKTMEERRRDAGMSLDGPHTLALCDFLTHFFHLGLPYLQALSTQLEQAVTVMRCQPGLPTGMVILVATLFRAIQGAMPPWAVESVPALYAALFVALGQDVTLYVGILGAAMRVRAISRYGGVEEGQLLAGRHFEGVSEHFHETFLVQVRDCCQANTTASWKRLKQVVKGACGGKKKETDYNQKPSPTRWQIDRV